MVNLVFMVNLKLGCFLSKKFKKCNEFLSSMYIKYFLNTFILKTYFKYFRRNSWKYWLEQEPKENP